MDQSATDLDEDGDRLRGRQRATLEAARQGLAVDPLEDASGARQRDFDRALAEAGPRKRGSLVS
jgi:hypothetical protein